MTIEWAWISDHASDLTTLSVSHLEAALSAVFFGLVISLPLAVLAHRVRPLRGFLLGLSNVLFTIPSIAVFVLLLPVSGLTRTTTVIGLTIYTLVVLLRNTVEGLDAVPARTREAAVAMGTRPLRMLLTVELPLALPVIMRGCGSRPSCPSRSSASPRTSVTAASASSSPTASSATSPPP